MDQTLTSAAFDAAYWAHQPLAVQSLQNMPQGGAREAQALLLASEGYVIDVPIMSWGMDPLLTMQLRQSYGYTWVPAALQPPVQLAPGVLQPGVAPYDPLHPPTGSIKVSTDPADYPPLVPPVTVPPPTASPISLVGVDEGAGYFQAFHAAAGQLADGQKYTNDPRGTFTFHAKTTPFGNPIWFTIDKPGN